MENVEWRMENVQRVLYENNLALTYHHRLRGNFSILQKWLHSETSCHCLCHQRSLRRSERNRCRKQRGDRNIAAGQTSQRNSSHARPQEYLRRAEWVSDSRPWSG